MLNLNADQRAAATHSDGPMMVLAGPGSGKTTVILHRIKYLIEERRINPKKILVITYTRAAAEEMRVRFAVLCGGTIADISTFHSLFYRVVSSHFGYTTDNVLQEAERAGVLKSILVNQGLASDDDVTREISTELSLITNELIDMEHHNSRAIGSNDFKNVCAAFAEYKKKHNKIDFDDMTVGCYNLFKGNKKLLDAWRAKYQYILIDEFQDINRAQYECIKLLNVHNNLFIVGDDDQSVYKFRGARPEFFLNFETDYPAVKKVSLDINYRSTDRIIGLCNKIISGNARRFHKNIRGTGINGPAPALLRPYDIQAEAVAVAERVQSIAKKTAYTDIAVIYRSNIQSRAFIDVFSNLHIPFQIKDEAPGIYEHWILKDVAAYFKLADDTGLNEETARIINKPKRYISRDQIAAAGKKKGAVLHNLMRASNIQTWQRAKAEDLIARLGAIKQLAPHAAYKYIREEIGYDGYIEEYAAFKRIKPDGLYEILDELTEGAKGFQSLPEYVAYVEQAAAESREKRLKKEEPAGVMLTTMHSAKGLEFEAVFIISAVDGLIPHEKSATAAETEEERRLFYVGLTRAKRILYISVVKTRHDNKTTPSVFLNGIIK